MSKKSHHTVKPNQEAWKALHIGEVKYAELQQVLGGRQVRRSHQSHDHASNEYQGRVSSQQFSLKFFLFDIAKFARIVCEEVRSCYGHICVL
jgi:hypothetical protein